TISAVVSASSRCTAPSGSGVPVGLFGELTTTSGACVSRAARTSASTSNWKSAVSATGTWRPPYTAASRRYRLNVGVGVTTAVPSPTVTASVAWISSLEPLPTSTPDATQAWRAAGHRGRGVRMRQPPLPAAAQDGFEPGRQGAGAERLRQEVVGAELEHAHFVILVSLGREHDDGDRRGRRTRPQVRQHAVAVEPRKIQIEDDD